MHIYNKHNINNIVHYVSRNIIETGILHETTIQLNQKTFANHYSLDKKIRNNFFIIIIKK